MLQHIALDHLHAHPLNANIMPRRLFAMLCRHLQESRDYPPLIVRPHPTMDGEYELLDGHHRARALRQIGASHADCVVWEDVDDDRAVMLLLTLNRLEGSDDPKKRGRLLHTAAAFDSCCPAGGDVELAAMLQRIPDQQTRVRRLIDLATKPPPPPAAACSAAQMLHAVTFFLTESEHLALESRLRETGEADRSRALLCALAKNRELPSS